MTAIHVSLPFDLPSLLFGQLQRADRTRTPMNWLISPRALPNDPETTSITKKEQIVTTATWYCI